MSKKQCMNKKLHPYYKTGIYGWLGEEVDDNDYIICPICGNVLGMNYWDYQAENDGDNKCPECEQELDYSEIYDFEDTCYFEQLLEIKESKITDLEAKLAESEKKLNQYPYKNEVIEEQYEDLKYAITFLMLNNIKDQERLNYSIDVLCEKHKARIRDIENGICRIEQLKQQLAEVKKWWAYQYNREMKNQHQDKISFAVEQLKKVKGCLYKIQSPIGEKPTLMDDGDVFEVINNQINVLRNNKDGIH